MRPTSVPLILILGSLKSVARSPTEEPTIAKYAYRFCWANAQGRDLRDGAAATLSIVNGTGSRAQQAHYKSRGQG